MVLGGWRFLMSEVPPHDARSQVGISKRRFAVSFTTVDPSFRALSGRLKFTVRRHKFNKDSLTVERKNHIFRSQAWNPVLEPVAVSQPPTYVPTALPTVEPMDIILLLIFLCRSAADKETLLKGGSLKKESSASTTYWSESTLLS